MMGQEEAKPQARRYFNFNTRVPDSGNIPKDKAELRIQFERALDEFFERRPSLQIYSEHEIERL